MNMNVSFKCVILFDLSMSAIYYHRFTMENSAKIKKSYNHIVLNFQAPILLK